MTLHPSLAKSLLLAAALGLMVPLHAASPKREETGNAESPPDRLPRKADVPPVVPGFLVAREDGRYVALAIEGGKFALRFLDEKKWKQDVQAKRALVRWKRLNKDDEERAVLNFNGTDALVGSMHVRPPYVFKAYVTLIGDDEKAIETIYIDHTGESAN